MRKTGLTATILVPFSGDRNGERLGVGQQDRLLLTPGRAGSRMVAVNSRPHYMEHVADILNEAARFHRIAWIRRRSIFRGEPRKDSGPPSSTEHERLVIEKRLPDGRGNREQVIHRPAQ
ncbi:MAG: hypothetical protein ACE5JA_05830 [bacterium]